MENTKKKLKGQSRVVKYSGLNTVAKYMNKQGIVKSISTLFPTEWHSARKFGVNQVLISIVMSSFCGNQQGAAKGINSTKKGAKSYHPLLVFVSEMKLLYHTWFRIGSAYTANGIVDFLKEVEVSLPENIAKVFFRADSGFFSVILFDLQESFGWDYLVKVKLKNLCLLYG